MFRHTFRGFLFAPESATGGGGGDPAPKVDMGIPHSFDDEKPPVVEKAPPAKTDVEKQLDSLRKDFESLEKRNKELSDSEKYWADRARGAAPVVQQDDDDDEDTLPANPFEGEKPEALLDDLTQKGLEALYKRGVPTRAELAEAAKNIKNEVMAAVNQKLAVNQKHNAVDQELAKYPELKDPNTPLFLETQRYFRRMVERDPSIKDQPNTLLSAVEFAKEKLDMEAKAAAPAETRQDTRRLRIAAQAGERPPVGGTEDDADDDELSPTAREVVGNLSKFLEVRDGKGKVAISAEDNYRRHLKRG